MKNKLKIFSGFYSLVLLSVFCFRDIHWCDETKIINNIFLITSGCVTAITGLLIIAMEIKEEKVNNQYNYFLRNYPNQPPFCDVEIPGWLIKISEKYPNWEKKFKNNFDTKKGKELLNEYYLFMEKMKLKE